VELLKQGQFVPLDIYDQVLSIYAGTRGHLDKVPTTDVQQWETEFLKFIHEQKPEILERMRASKDMDDQTMQMVEASIKDFQQQFAGRKKQVAAA
jgi:F-type H+/Na+-transporting ATPase subunit alpha